jgi:energy-converting hydrogenase Eha subunit B
MAHARHRSLAQEQRGDLSTGAIAGTLASGSLERFVRLAGMTSLVFIVGFLFGLMTLSTFTKRSSSGAMSRHNTERR